MVSTYGKGVEKLVQKQNGKLELKKKHIRAKSPNKQTNKQEALRLQDPIRNRNGGKKAKNRPQKRKAENNNSKRATKKKNQ